MTELTDIFDNEQWDRVFEELFKNKELCSSIDPADLAWKRYQYQLAENGKSELVAPFGKKSDLLKVIELCKQQGMLGLTIPQATAFQQVEQIKNLLSNGHHIDEEEFCETTGLLVAAALNDYELVKYFIDNGAFVSFLDQDNNEAIDLTTSKEISDLLSKNKGKTKEQRADDYDAYCIARENLNDHREANISFIKAAQIGDLTRMKEALTNNTMPFITIDYTDYESGNTALHYAVIKNDSNAVKFLLANRIDTKKKNKQELTALELAKQIGNEKLFDNDKL